MAKSLLEEIVNQITGRRKPTYHNKSDRQTDKFLYQIKKNTFEMKKQAEIMKHKAKSKGWI
jgi:hypothetical protein